MSKMDTEKLKEIVANDASGVTTYVSAEVGKPLVDAGLIEVNTAITNPANPAEVACRATDAGKAKVASGGQEQAKSSGSHAQIVTGAVLPPAKKRGNSSGSGAPTKYPFADLEVGGMFFSPNSDHAKGDAVKALGSTVSAQNDKYSENTGEMKTVTRAVRDKQTKKAVTNPDGSKQTETVQLPVKKYNRKFTIRPVVGGETYGSWTAPSDGALVARTI
jgi:hypothetical protein